MRKLLLLALAACLAFAGCRSNDDNDDSAIRYDEAKGYLTNLASAKHGIVGRWSAGTARSEYGIDGVFCTGTHGDEVLPHCLHTYEIFENKGKIYLKYKQISTNTYGYDLEITALTKTFFSYMYNETTYRFYRDNENDSTP